MKLSWIKLFLITVLVFGVAAVLAYNDHFMFRWQLEAQKIFVGTPLFDHWGVRSDVLLLPFALELMFSYSYMWELAAIVLSSIFGVALSLVANFAWGEMATRVPNCFAHDSGMTAAGWIHLWFMAVVFTVITLFYFASNKNKGVWRSDARKVWLMLTVHISAGTVGCALYVHDPIWNFQIMGMAALGWVMNSIGYLYLKRKRLLNY